MNKIKTLLLVLCATALTGCVGKAGKVDTDPNLLNDFDDAIVPVEYNGHKYIIYKGVRKGGIIHDPDCPCHQKGVSDND